MGTCRKSRSVTSTIRPKNSNLACLALITSSSFPGNAPQMRHSPCQNVHFHARSGNWLGYLCQIALVRNPKNMAATHTCKEHQRTSHLAQFGSAYRAAMLSGPPTPRFSRGSSPLLFPLASLILLAATSELFFACHCAYRREV